MKLSNFFHSIKSKFLIFIVLILLFLAISFAFYSLSNLKENLYEEKRTQTKEMVEVSLGILRKLNQQKEQGKFTTKEAQEQALEIIKNMSFGTENRNYYWIQNEKPIMLMHPNSPELVSEYIGDIQDQEGKYIFKRMTEIINQQGSGFLEYHWQYYDEEDRIEPKLSYVEEFEPWDWIIGAGIYINDIETKYINMRNQYILIGTGILIFTILLTYLLSHYFTDPLLLVTNALEKLTGHNLEFTNKASLNKHSKRKDEIGDMIKSLFEMQTNLSNMTSKLQKSQKNLKATLNSIGDAVIATDIKGNIIRMNSVAEDLTDWNFKNAKGKSLEKVFKIINAKTRKPVQTPTKKVLQTGKKVGLANHTLLISKNGTEYQISDSASPIRDSKGKLMGVVLVFRDITEEYQMQKEIKTQKERLESIIEGTNVGTWEWNVQTGEIILNEKWAEMIGYSLEELQPASIETWQELTHPEDLKKAQDMLNKHFKGEIEQYDMELRMKHKKGHWVWFLARGRVISWNNKGKPLWMFGTHLDISDRKKREEKIRYISHHDGVTNLYNRTYMEKEIKKLNTKNNLPLSIIMTDINGLKIINEGFGHQKGDEVLIQTADILRSCVREDDVLARWSGDEFIILLPQTNEKQTKNIIKRIRNKSQETKNENIPISFGIGYALKTNTDQKIYEVLHKAEDKVYQDKLTKNRSVKNKLVQNMLNTLGAKSHETKAHAQRMSKMSYKLGQKLDLNNEQLNNLSLLATLHDIGKVNIAEEILKKPDSLNNKEWQAIKKHPQKGYSIASAIEEFTPIAESILAHHERWDGDGYPQGLAGEEIPLLARIISLVDAYDVMTNGRPYKEPMSKEEAIKELKDCAESQFDPELVEKFVEVIA